MKLTDKGFIVHWIDKRESYIIGSDIHNALVNFGYPDSAAFIDWYDEPKEFPKDKKILVQYYKNGKLLKIHQETIYFAKILENINKGKEEFSFIIANNKFDIMVKEFSFTYQIIDISNCITYSDINENSYSGGSIRKFIKSNMEHDESLTKCFKQYIASNSKFPIKDDIYYYLNRKDEKCILIRDLKKSPRNK